MSGLGGVPSLVRETAQQTPRCCHTGLKVSQGFSRRQSPAMEEGFSAPIVPTSLFTIFGGFQCLWIVSKSVSLAKIICDSQNSKMTLSDPHPCVPSPLSVGGTCNYVIPVTVSVL